MNAPRFLRPELAALPARGEDARGGARLRLDRNENPFAFAGAGDINRYPPDAPAALVQRLADIYGVDTGNVLTVRDAQDGADLLLRSICAPGADAAVVMGPAPQEFSRAALLHGVRLTAATNADEAQEAAHEAAAKLVYLSSPDPLSGALAARAEILELAERLPDALVVVDESLIEFAGAASSLAGEAARRENLAVLRSLSAAYGIAGARCGAVVAAPGIIELLARAAPAGSIPSPAADAAFAALSPASIAVAEQRIETIIAERERLTAALSASSLVSKVHQGAANFLLVEARDAAAVKQRLAARGVSVFWRDERVLRLTVGAPAENNLVLDAFGAGAPAASPSRRAEIRRATRETDIAVAVDLDRDGPVRIATGLGYLDHMLEQVARHGGFSLVFACKGDLEVDAHHTIEDCMLALGEALRGALGERRGIARFGAALPMDEAEAEALIDLSGRPYALFEGAFAASHIGDWPTEMTGHAVRSLAESLRAAVHVKTRGENDHHKTEACFKALGRALRQAIRIESESVPSTKGVLA